MKILMMFARVVSLAVLCLVGCDSDQDRCAANCAGRGYSYAPVGAGFIKHEPARCICGPNKPDGGTIN